MKKVFFLLLLTFSAMVANAQRPQMSREDMEKMRAERVQKQAEKMAKDFELKDDAKANFIALYTEYNNALVAVQMEGRNHQRTQQEPKKKLSDEEAQKQVDEFFARQEQQVAQSQKRLDVMKTYRAEFQKILTPQQMAKVFTQQQQRQGQWQGQGGQRPNYGGGQRGGGNYGGGFGGDRGGFGGEF